MVCNSDDWPDGEPLLGVTHSSSVVLPLPLLASLFLSSSLHLLPLLLLLPFGLLYLWLGPLMWKKPSSGPVDLEIEYSSRSARDKPCSVRAHQAKGVGGNEFQLRRARGLCWLFSRRSLRSLWSSEANTTLPISLKCFETFSETQHARFCPLTDNLNF